MSTSTDAPGVADPDALDLGYDDAIVTGEGVALELPAATVLSRILAGALDYGLYALIWIALVSWYSNSADHWQTPQTTDIYMMWMIVITAAVWWLIPTTVTALSRGSSLGKLVAGVRVVRYDGGSVTVRQSVIRHLIGIFEVWLTLGSAAVIISIFSRRGSRAGDMLAGTYVVRWPRSSSRGFEVHMPAGLEGWASIVQTRALPANLSTAITRHLRRRDQLDPAVRARQASTLAAQAEQYVSPPPPWGTPSEDFLSALTIIRNYEDVSRGERQQKRYHKTLESISVLPYGL